MSFGMIGLLDRRPTRIFAKIRAPGEQFQPGQRRKNVA
jgi:hypothetical protein